MTLRWEGPSAHLAGSVLTDEETGQEIEVQGDGTYTFVMTGTSRSFRWMVKAGNQAIFSDGFESGNTSAWSNAVGE